jgi:hypothetical protein
MGTAIHGALHTGILAHDPFNEEWLTEVEVTRDGLMGHVDAFHIPTGEVVDWKTSVKKNLARGWPADAQRWQVHTYGWLLSGAGHDVRTVTLVGIPRDGDERALAVHSEPYDPAVALEALAWLGEVRALTEAPAPEKHASFCNLYCPFFGPNCGGVQR